MLKHRILTAMILIPFVLWGIIALPAFYFNAIAVTIFTLVAWEWGRLCLFWRWASYFYALLFFLGAAWCSNSAPHQAILLSGTLFWLLPLLYCVTYRGTPTMALGIPLFRAIMGYIVMGIACYALIVLRSLDNGAQWLLGLLMTIWISDSFAYFGGRCWGKHSLARMISPNKTIEGLLCGLIGATVVVPLVFYFLLNEVAIGFFLGVVFLTACFGVLGDLFESLLKRTAGVKDSGTFLPGHGGVLDRLDSLLAALPFYTFCLLYAQRG